MYDRKTINRVLKLLKLYEDQITKVARETGIKVRTITEWKRKRDLGLPIITRDKHGTSNSKWSKEEKEKVVDYYFKHGESAAKAIKEFGYPKRTTLMSWVKKDKRFKKQRIFNKTSTQLSENEKVEATIELGVRNKSAYEIAKSFNVTRETLYSISKRLTGESATKVVNNVNKEELIENYTLLQQEHKRLLIENKILKKANQVLKKDMGDDYLSLTNKEKTEIVIALQKEFKVSELLPIIILKKATFFYEKRALTKDKYQIEKRYITQLFHDNYQCYGYRRIKKALSIEFGLKLSEKVIRRIMKELKLLVYVPKKAKYSSYKGEISPESENIVKRDFISIEPYVKALTDITEFALSDGKVYLSPLVDCFTGTPITWTIGTAPATELTNTMLDHAFQIIGHKKLIIHSDRGFHYRLNSWIDRMTKYGYIRSMSKKGCSPDNSACEGFFGTLKNEFYYAKNWATVKREVFIKELNKYLNWFVTKRIKKRLNYLSVPDYMLNYQKEV